MAYLPMISGGDAMNPTVLWMNNAPTSDFANQTLNLSDDVMKYDYLRIDYKGYKTENTIYHELIAVSDFILTNHGNTACKMPMLGYKKAGTYTTSLIYKRLYSYDTNTTVYFGASTTLSESGTSTNGYIIPTQIIGLK